MSIGLYFDKVMKNVKKMTRIAEQNFNNLKKKNVKLTL